MRVMICLRAVAEFAQRLDYRVLGLSLAGINYVVNFGDIAEMRMLRLTLLRRYPALVPAGIAIKLSVSEVATQQAKLPHVIRDVFADVADGAVRPHNHFLVFLGDRLRALSALCGGRFCGSRAPHHPTAL